MGKNLLFYAVSGTVIGVVLELAGVDFMVSMLASLLGPPFILLLIAAAKWRGLF